MLTDLKTKELHLRDLESWRLPILVPSKLVAGKFAYVFCRIVKFLPIQGFFMLKSLRLKTERLSLQKTVWILPYQSG